MRQGDIKNGLKVVLLGLLLLMGFNNCSKHNGTDSGSDGFNSAAAINCEENLFSVFDKNVYPFLATPDHCASCHVEGGEGIGTFASPNHRLAFSAFRGVGWQKVSLKAVDKAHKQPYTGDQNKPKVDELNVLWPKSENDYMQCMAKAQSGGLEDSLQTSAKAEPSIYQADTEKILSWDLELAEELDVSAQRSVPAIFSVKVRVLYDSSTPRKPIGYAFTDPNIVLKSNAPATLKLIVEGLYVYMNGQLLSNLSTFSTISKIVADRIPSNGTAYVPYTLLKAAGTALVQPISTDDSFSFYFRRIVATSESDAIPTPSAPILSLSDPNTGSENFIATTSVVPNILRDNGIVRWCLTTSATPPATTEETCPGQLDSPGTVNGWFITKPNLFQVPAGDGLKQVYLWVANGALKINSAISTDSITMDTVPPAKPSILTINGNAVVNNGIGSGNIGTMQVTNMTVSTDPDVKGWCVFERADVLGSPANAPALNDRCWRWSYDNKQPTTVGFKAGGLRRVILWVRDEAGNISPASDYVTVNNPHGAITFTKLTQATDGLTDQNVIDQAVFYRECRECHMSAGQPGYARFPLFDYGEALARADNGLLESRTNNPYSPMPNKNSGLMDKRYRDLIRLWMMPEDPKANPAP